MKIDNNLTEFDNLLRLINATNPELKLRADQVKSVRAWMNNSGIYTEKNSIVDIEMVEGRGFSGKNTFYYDRVTLQGFNVIPEYLPPLPVLLSDTPETILARYAKRHELASDTTLFTNYFSPPTADKMYGSISIAVGGSSLLYHEASNLRLMRVDSLDEDLPIFIMTGNNTLDGFEPTRHQLLRDQ